MAKLELIFCGVTGTLTSEGKPSDPIDVSMTTGSEHIEGFCYYSVPWTKCTIVRDPNNSKDDDTKKASGEGTVCFAFNLQNVRFTKKMYSPNEIYAEIQIAPGNKVNGQNESNVTYLASIPKDTLEASFINKKVVLKCDDIEACNDYFIQEIAPTYKKDAMYVTFRMYSPDFLLTQEEYCRSFVTKKLGSEILADQIKNYKLFGSSIDVCIDYSLMKHIKKNGKPDGPEHIFPYLVQYNESFYDFLKRTTNRWGEFLYYEDNKLLVGYGYAAEANGDYKDMASSVTYSDLTNNPIKQANAGVFNTEAPIDSQILDNKLKKGDYDKVYAEINSLGDNSLDGDVYLMKKLEALFTNDKSILPFILNQGIHDGISLYKAQKISDDLNEKFDDAYFNKKNKDNVTYGSEQFNGNEFNEFSEYTPFLTIEDYAKILKKELASGQNAIVLDFDTTYPGIKLGQIIKYDKKNYLVVKVEGYQPDIMRIVDNQYVVIRVDMEKVCYKVTAIPESRVESADTTFYPTMIPEGHVRRSGAQLAKVVDADDPLRKNRVRVKFDWQSDASEKIPSPWLIYSNPAGSFKEQSKTNVNRNGIIGKHYVGEPVLVDFAYGNVERPYVVGSVETNVPPQLKTNDIVLTTPGMQTIKMTDGLGLGVNALLASINPGVSILQAGFPGLMLGNFDKSEYLEGAIELGDKYGFWSIKGSTNDRNITLKSPWGDVSINAFTGITISAPNGDIKIKGKNVSIEAGSNLTLKSGKNIDDKFLVESEDMSSKDLGSISLMIAKGVSTAIANNVAELTDLSLLRHLLEVFLKPVEGKLQITAGRYMMLESGRKQTGYPIDAYKANWVEDKASTCADIKICVESFESLKGLIDQNYAEYENLYNVARQRRNTLVPLINNCVNSDGTLQCKSLDDICKDLWNSPNKDSKEALGFTGLYKDVKESDDPDYGIIAKFLKLEVGLFVMSPALLKKKWKAAIERQEAQKSVLIIAVTLLKESINNMKNFELVKPAGRLKELDSLMTMDHLPDCCVFKNFNIKDRDDLNVFSVNFVIGEDEKKTVYRKLFIDLVNKFEIKRSALICSGLMSKPKVAPEPQAPYNSNKAWSAYVRSIQSLPVKEPTKKEEMKASFVDPLANLFSATDFKTSFYDDWAYGSSKKGEILFASEDGTMVLDRNIYRANVGGSENVVDENGNVLVDGYAVKVRNAMLSV